MSYPVRLLEKRVERGGALSPDRDVYIDAALGLANAHHAMLVFLVMLTLLTNGTMCLTQ